MAWWRPQHFTKEQIDKIIKDFIDYINLEDDPTIVWFTASYPPIHSETLWRYAYINKDFISDHEEFSELRKRAIEKQENYLLKWVTANKLNATMWVFRLKQPQHWFTDKQEIDQKTEHSFPELSQEQLKKIANQVK